MPGSLPGQEETMNYLHELEDTIGARWPFPVALLFAVLLAVAVSL